MKYYTYVHYTSDTKELFYVGKGQGKRAYQTSNRNRWWHNKVTKHGGFEVVVLSYWPTELDALMHEKFLIDCLEQKGTKLVNISKAIGKETEGRKLSQETRERMSTASKAKWAAISAEERAKWALAAGGSNKGKPKTEQHKQNLSKARTGLKVPSIWKPILCITTGVLYPSLTEAAVSTGCDASHIVKCCKGKIKKIHNKEFAYG